MSNGVNISGSSFNINGSRNIKIGNSISSNSDVEALVREIIEKTKSLSTSRKLSHHDSESLEKSILQLEKCMSCNSLSGRLAQESLKTIRNVAEGMTGSVIATWLLSSIAKVVF